MRAPYQVLIFPFIKEAGKYYYAIFERRDLGIWQGIAGGGEGNESPIEAARREACEEALIDKKARYIRLASMTTIPAVNICGLKWGDIIMIPELAFGVEAPSKELKISHEHTQYLWLSYEQAIKKLKYDSNKSALYELDYRLKNGLTIIAKNIQSIKNFL
ncbi:MAG: NUDIX pyrophosphatase [Patescibacteria group bacterium]